jgi:hypothetical protein
MSLGNSRKRIPTGFHRSALGCEERATQGRPCRDLINPERVVSGAKSEACCWPGRYNPFRVGGSSRWLPRVVRASQPWAGGFNPCGIGDGLTGPESSRMRKSPEGTTEAGGSQPSLRDLSPLPPTPSVENAGLLSVVPPGQAQGELIQVLVTLNKNVCKESQSTLTPVQRSMFKVESSTFGALCPPTSDLCPHGSVVLLSRDFSFQLSAFSFQFSFSRSRCPVISAFRFPLSAF